MQDFNRYCKPSPGDRVLDVGTSGNDWFETCNNFLRQYPHPQNITALGMDDYSAMVKKYPQIEFTNYDGRIFPFRDNSFEICHSNAVIEHVGDFDRQQLFVAEMVRVAQRGFFTTPNRWFPVEVHAQLPLVHYLPRSAFVRIAGILGRQVAGLHLLDAKCIRQLISRTPITSYTIIPNRAFGLTATYSVFWRK
jgi:hypothetical protein